MVKTTRRRKGTDFQRWIKKYLEERGWIVHNQTLCSKKVWIAGEIREVSTRQDIFSADLIARKIKNFNEPFVDDIKGLRWIQSSYSSNVKKRYEDFLKYFKFLLDGESFQLWIKTKSGQINIFDFTMDACRQTGKIIRRKHYGIKEI